MVSAFQWWCWCYGDRTEETTGTTVTSCISSGSDRTRRCRVEVVLHGVDLDERIGESGDQRQGASDARQLLELVHH